MATSRHLWSGYASPIPFATQPTTATAWWAQAGLEFTAQFSHRSQHRLPRWYLFSYQRPRCLLTLVGLLDLGCISMREVVQQTRTQLDMLPPQASRHRAGLTGFLSRLYWHCHFIQKLEREPAIEWRNMHRGYDGLREQEFNLDYFEALKNARTGWPMVDACVVMLRKTGRAGKKEVVEKHASRKKPKSVFKPSSLQSENKQKMGFDF